MWWSVALGVGVVNGEVEGVGVGLPPLILRRGSRLRRICDSTSGPSPREGHLPIPFLRPFDSAQGERKALCHGMDSGSRAGMTGRRAGIVETGLGEL